MEARQYQTLRPVRGGLAVWVRGLVLVLMSGSDSVVPSPAAGGGSGGGLVKGVWLWFKRTSMSEPGNSLAVSGLINLDYEVILGSYCTVLLVVHAVGPVEVM